MSYWECSCGARWAKWSINITRHVSAGRAKREKHKLLGLFDDTGKLLAKTMVAAVAQGIVPRSKWKGRKRLHRKAEASLKGEGAGAEGGTAGGEGGGAEAERGAAEGGVGGAGAPEVRTSVRGRFVTEEVLLDGRLLNLYELARARFPEYDATVGEWIWDVVVQFYAEHSDELGLGVLFADTFEPQLAKAEVGDG